MRTDTSRPASAGTRAAELGGALGFERKLDVDRRRRVVVVLDLGLGERGAAVNAPVDRLLALVDEPPLDELAERARDVRLVARASSSGRGGPSRRRPRGA